MSGEVIEVREVSPGYELLTAKPTVPAGYKQTAAGIIPEDWQVEPLGKHVTITSGESPSLIQFSDYGTPYFKVEQLGNSGKYLTADFTPYHFSQGKTVATGSVIFAKRGAAIALNKVRLLSTESFMDTNLMALTPHQNLSCEYLYYQLGHIGLWRFADTTSVPQINNKHVNPLLFPLPSLEEQHAIATALSDVDALLEDLDRLIAKKRDLKQATMQQLLTGQTRLPGFEGEWWFRRLGEVVVSLDAGASVNSVSGVLSDGKPCILKTSALVNGKLVTSESKVIDNRDLSRATTNPKRDTILISRMNTPSLVGEVAYVEKDYDWLYLPDRIWMARFKSDSEVCVRWLAYILSSPFYRESLREMATGTSGSMKNISKPALLSLTVQFPSRREQEAIGKTLSDLDVEIRALEQRRAKTAVLKQAMMQELLTGRTRLV